MDKESEGLLLFSNDPKFYDLITESNFKIEKEYYVEVDKQITTEMMQQLSEGIVIMGQKTLPAKVEKVNDFSFSIILIQGLNRQIRRMCRKLGFEVTKLVRVRIGEIYLGVVKKTADFGAFVEIKPGVEGLVHISQLAANRVNKTEDVVKEGEEILVKVIELDRSGKIKLSRKDAIGKNPTSDTRAWVV